MAAKKTKATKAPKAAKAVKASKAPSGIKRGNVLVIVESPTKAKTIRKFLPKGYKVEACVGHIRDLPASAKEIPAKYKKEKWASLGINVDDNFTPLYVIPTVKQKIIKKLKEDLEESDELILATDEDREGESISHHLVEVLKPTIPVKRMVFHEITKSAIQESLENFREVDQAMVRAQETRRILDRLVGYSLSPLIWKKIAYGLSAGRVQSVAVKIIVEREHQRLAFRKGIYCGILASLSAKSGEFEAKLVKLNGKRVATGKDFDEHTGQIATDKRSDVLLLLKEEAEKLVQKLPQASWKVREITEKPLSRKPAAPFITSTLQQESNRKLGLSSRDTMRVAQKLYEQGLITYMRTDSVNLSNEAIEAARRQVEKLYGKEYLSPEIRRYQSKSKSAQEAHEAIRPAGQEFPRPEETGLIGREKELYELIWKRTIATQMADSRQLSIGVSIEAGEAEFQANGTRMLFPGFLRAYVEGSDDVEAALEERDVILPDLKQSESLKTKELEVTEHETKPPARFTEASLVQTLEKEGVGRPSTYASIIGTIIDRGYVRRINNSLIPTFTAMAVNKLLVQHFPELVDLKFTAQMEESLDEIAEGKKNYLEFLTKFYSDEKNGLRAQIASREKKIDPEEARAVKLDDFPDVEFRIGRFGPYFVVNESVKKGGKASTDEGVIRASIPEDIAPADINQEQIDHLIQLKKDGPPSLGEDPKSGQKVFLMSGRYGNYLQLGMPDDPETKPKRSVLPAGIDPKTLQLEEALGYLYLPRELGHDPEGHKVSAGLGRFGPFVVKTGGGLEKPEYRSLKKTDNVLTVDFARATEIFAEPKRGRGRRGSTALRVIGEHPKDKTPLEIYDGPYGLYIKCGKVNASLPKEIKPEDIALEKAVELIEAKRG
ncbi:MAG: DNA topoisomerase I [Deltaproteobacteria bacterium CG11_big_fil_rev_8_21_14_0_20_45_16]|nr:MAG: DNA topoisomerase I [Deltaproteobacteria bacterium CG11_big_fil_rev_8_21_14_0_20_45_16]